MNDLMGVNVDARDDIDRVARFSIVRNYHDWSKDTGFPDTEGVISCPPEFNLSWDPSKDGSDLYSFDLFYENMAHRVIPSLKGVHPEMYGYKNFPFDARFMEQKPICTPGMNGLDVPLNQVPGTEYLSKIPDATDPAIYLALSKWITLYSARYGHTSRDQEGQYVMNFIKNNIDPNESPKTGQMRTDFVEPNNEPDKTWYDSQDDVMAQNQNPMDAITYWYLAPEQYAALVSATYDGHGKSPAFKISEITNEEAFYGAVNADPEMEYVLAGLADLRGNYIERMVAWFEANRQPNGNYGFVEGPIIPFDVINFHHYSTELSATSIDKTSFDENIYNDLNAVPINIAGDAVSPEADLLQQKIGWFMTNLEANTSLALDDIEVWYTEFGYDSENSTVETSGVNVPNYGDPCRDGQSVQADWTIRSVLEISATGLVDRATIFNLTNDQTLGTNSYSSSGLLDDHGNPKKLWYYVMTTRNLIGDLSYNEQDEFEISNSTNPTMIPPRVYTYTQGNNKVYAIWSPTSNDVAYSMDLEITQANVEIDNATLVELQEPSEQGVRTDLGDISNNTFLNIPVSETPVFIVVNEQYPFGENIGVTTMNPDRFSVTSVCCDGVMLSYRAVNDGIGFPGTGPIPNLPARYSIYYARQSEMALAVNDGDPTDDWNEFDLSLSIDITNAGGGNENTQVIHLHYDNSVGTVSSIFGLEPGEEYWFWVIPTDIFGNMTANIDPCDADNDLASMWTEGIVGGCPTDDCLIDVESDWVNTPYTGNNLNNVIASLKDGESSCNILEQEIDPNANFYQEYGPNAENWFEVNFPEAYRINAIHWFDGFGIGDMQVQYNTCSCDEWRDLTILHTNGVRVWDSWSVRPIIVKGLRFTKIHEEARIPAIRFCGEEQSCNSGGGGAISSLNPPNNIGVSKVTTTEAILNWMPSYDNNDLIYDDYEIFFEKTSNFDENNLETNMSVSSNPANENGLNTVDELKPTSNYASKGKLTNLEPSTSYTALVRVVLGPCGGAVPGIRTMSVSTPIEFTTLGIEQAGKKSEDKSFQLTDYSKAYDFNITPNPTKRDFVLDFAQPTNRVELIDITGKVVQYYNIDNISRMVVPLNRTKIRSGIYLVRAISANNEISTKRVVIID